MAEPVDVDGLPVRLSKTDQKKWDAGGKQRTEVRNKIRGWREEDLKKKPNSKAKPVSFVDKFGDS